MRTNRTVDDEHGDAESGIQPTYFPSTNVWSQGTQCPDCGVNSSNVDLSKVHDGTWHDGTYRPGGEPLSIAVTFTGVAVYVYNIIANSIPPTITFSNISFYLDGDYAGQFVHSPDDSSIMQYNVLVFHNSNLANAPHTLLMTASGASISLGLFDYLVYTVDDASPAVLVSSKVTIDSVTPSSLLGTSQARSQSLAFSGTLTSTLSEDLPSSTSPGFIPTASGDISYSKESLPHGTITIIPTSLSTPAVTATATRSDVVPPAGTIVGVSLGCIILFVLTCVAVWLRRRLRKESLRKISPSSLRVLRNEDFDGRPEIGFDRSGSPAGAYGQPETTAMLNRSSGASATLGASVHEFDSERTLVTKHSMKAGNKCLY
ncbi:hypothetical protein L226DRAFT_565597 [Lentinus tigrinus ALCF2SS1-7]|uniref:Uncharacterized protein n=1 Tax=Lentinus tigrinus ALCF2SS1-6 TaxID=1328759 RepID=A0A5C2SSI8_9APHY|nr:hypothetical protein L227DRAFT_605257 [Lentinus tigrinus ALCF2SS1-6]RPD80757.1 hypothetical protein L226DRAFT_565597 [Lentinus tigrinus ALCF2SS1-7]